MTPPRLSEPFSTPNSQGTKPPPLSSTPLVPSTAKYCTNGITIANILLVITIILAIVHKIKLLGLFLIAAGILSVIDTNLSGFVKVDDIINYWQEIGIETPHNESLENILTEVCSMGGGGLHA